MSVAGRLGFGIGVGLGIAGGESLHALRWWVLERVALMPALRLGIGATKAQDRDWRRPSGTVAPELVLGYVPYRGPKTRVVASIGPGFEYVGDRDAEAGATKALTFQLLGGLALEQFFTPRFSIVAGTVSPLFRYTSLKVASEKRQESIGASLDLTRFVAAAVFYTD